MARKGNFSEKEIIDKNSVQYLKYKDIAIDFIKQGYNNIRSIYAKYYPKASEDSLRTEPYRLLDCVRFQIALEDAWSEIKVEDLDIANEVIQVLRKEMFTAKKSSDRTNAASWLGKSKAMFTDKQEVATLEKEDNQFSLSRLSRIKQADTQ
jgi:hypothetical protein